MFLSVSKKPASIDEKASFKSQSVRLSKCLELSHQHILDLNAVLHGTLTAVFLPWSLGGKIKM